MLTKAESNTTAPGPHLARLVWPSAIGATAAAVAAVPVTLAALEVWVMFVGLVAFFTRPGPARQALATFACAIAGLTLGLVAMLALGWLQPSLGVVGVALVVFAVGMLVLSLRAVKPFDNAPAWFLGLIAFFASHPEPVIGSIVPLAIAIGVGCAAGLAAALLQSRLVPGPTQTETARRSDG